MFMVNFVLTQPLVISILAESAPLWREAVLTIHSTKCIKYIKQIKKIPNIVYTISYRHPGQEHPKSPKIRAFIISSARCSSDDKRSGVHFLTFSLRAHTIWTHCECTLRAQSENTESTEALQNTLTVFCISSYYRILCISISSLLCLFFLPLLWFTGAVRDASA